MTPSTARAQSFRFSLRADPDVIPANGISTASILVQVQSTGSAAIAAAPVVRFVASDGTIERQTRLSGGVARVLLRSSTTPGTALITAFVGNAREQITVEFSAENFGLARYYDVSASYLAYGASESVVTASGRCSFTFGETHIESDVRLDLDVNREYLWAEGGAGNVLIRQGSGRGAHELRGDRLFYDIRRRRGVMRRSDATLGPARQEFMGGDFRPLPAGSTENAATSIDEKSDAKNVGQGRTVGDATPVAKAAERQPESPVIDTTSRPPVAATLIEPPGSDVAPVAHEPAADVIPETEKANPEKVNEGEVPSPKVRPNSGVLLSRDKADSSVTSHPKIAPRTSVVLPSTQSDDATGARAQTSLVAVIAPDGATVGSASTNVSPLRAPGKTPDETLVPQASPAYRPLESAPDETVRLSEPLPPQADIEQGYWIVARRLSVYPHDKIQFERATLFLNAGKLLSMPRYVVPLGGAFNPAQDVLGFNSAAGVTLNLPIFYQASPRGQGTLYIQHAPGGGFAAEKPGFALALDQQYWLSRNSSGRVVVDQIGHAWNLNFAHKMQISPTTTADFSLDMPQHRDAYLRSSLLKEFSSMQVGLESFYTRPREGENDFQGQFFARLRPRDLGNSDWTYTLSASAAMWQRYPELVAVNGGSGSSSGGGVGLPGRPRPGSTTFAPRYRRVTSQTLDLSLQGPQYKLWSGAVIGATVRATAFNQSLGRRGASPGLTLDFGQRLGRIGSLQLGYTYDKSGGLFTGSNLTHLVSGSVSLVPLRKLAFNAYATQSLSDRSLYGFASFDYQIAPKWRAGLFGDLSRFAGAESFLDYGWTLGRTIGQREITMNYSRLRNRIYFELGGFRL